MKKIKLDKLEGVILFNEKIDNFTGFTTEKHFDAFNKEYELVKDEEEYFYFMAMLNQHLYTTKTYLLETLLSKEIKMAENNEIYEHGYPEARLIPSDFYEKCREGFIDETVSTISDLVENILNEYITYKDFDFE